MQSLLNKTSHTIFAGDLFLVPGKPVPVKDPDAFLSCYPYLEEAAAKGEVKILGGMPKDDPPKEDAPDGEAKEDAPDGEAKEGTPDGETKEDAPDGETKEDAPDGETKEDAPDEPPKSKAANRRKKA